MSEPDRRPEVEIYSQDLGGNLTRHYPPEPDAGPSVVEVEPVQCTCEWAIADTGNFFYSRISKPDPDCPAHRR